MTFPTLIEYKNIWQFSEQWFDDCLSRYDQLLETPLPSHFNGTANNDDVMCQHFSGHKVKQILAAFRSPLATHSDWQNEAVHGYKTLRYIQIYPA